MSNETKHDSTPAIIRISHFDLNNEFMDASWSDLDSIPLKHGTYIDSTKFDIIMHSSAGELSDTVKLIWRRPDDTLLYSQKLYSRTGYKTISINKETLRGLVELSVDNRVLVSIDLPVNYNYLLIKRHGDMNFWINYSNTLPPLTD